MPIRPKPSTFAGKTQLPIGPDSLSGVFSRAAFSKTGSQGARLLAGGLALIVCLLSTPSNAEPTKHGFEDWAAVIEEGGTRYCRPRGYLFSSGKVPDFQLRVIRSDASNPCGIALVSAFRFVDLHREMRVRVDGNPALRLEVALIEASGRAPLIYRVTDASTAGTLLRRMRAGARIRFDYVDLLGQPSSAVFSLMGASAALDVVGCGGSGR